MGVTSLVASRGKEFNGNSDLLHTQEARDDDEEVILAQEGGWGQVSHQSPAVVLARLLVQHPAKRGLRL